MKMQKNERGITLVALVVTIVVLLILAGVTIMYVMSDNGIFGKAQDAGVQSNGAAVREAVFLSVSGLYAEVYTNDAEAGEPFNAAMKAAFEKSIPADMKVGMTSGTVTATKANPSSITINGYSIKYKGTTYTVGYSSSTGVTVTGDDGYGTTTPPSTGE
ncbi:MAG: type II secretion system protein [Clostridia bacterium]|nr:type II secretion system protein [Clostridia bacterium]